MNNNELKMLPCILRISHKMDDECPWISLPLIQLLGLNLRKKLSFFSSERLNL